MRTTSTTNHFLTGSGGGNDFSSTAEHVILVGLQAPDKFPAKLDFLSSPGHLTGGDSRKKAGLRGAGPQCVVTQLGIMDFEPVSKRMRIKSLNPGITPEICQQCTGFELLLPETIGHTPAPSPEVLEVLRREVDPRAIFTAFPPRIK